MGSHAGRGKLKIENEKLKIASEVRRSERMNGPLPFAVCNFPFPGRAA
jgi:hypothetical protein